MLNDLFLKQQGDKLYVEDVFSTYLYSGNSSTQTITNGIDLAGKGGLVWIKARNAPDGIDKDHLLNDTARGVDAALSANTISPPTTGGLTLSRFNSGGFSLFSNTAGALYGTTNLSGGQYTSWTFRKAPKFFDIVVYTGTGLNRTIPHSLGVAPGCIIIKRTDTSSNWMVYHRSYGTGGATFINTDSGSSVVGGAIWNNTAPTDAQFSVGSYQDVNASGGTYVAYLFAHDATASGVIQCGSYIGNGSSSGPTVTLGWEPQWLLIVGSGTSGGNNQATSANWQIIDNMRGMAAGSVDATLQTNFAFSESALNYVSPTATGFQIVSTNNQVNQALSSTGNPVQYNYIAIRRGPMKTPTSGASVFSALTYTGDGTLGTLRSAGFPVDLVWSGSRSDPANKASYDRLRGAAKRIETSTTSAEVSETASAVGLAGFDSNVGYWAGQDASSASINYGLYNYVNWMFRRAPGFFDVVCYTGDGSTNQAVAHGLKALPELILAKRRDASRDWVGTVHSGSNWLNAQLNSTGVTPTATQTDPQLDVTSTTFNPYLLRDVANSIAGNESGGTYVAYLFASCPGVSKVGTYTGNGSSQTINCGFSNGARFVMVKRTDQASDWFVFDTARGNFSSTLDPVMVLNSAATEAQNGNVIGASSSGFTVIFSDGAAGNVNINGGTYIYLAIA